MIQLFSTPTHLSTNRSAWVALGLSLACILTPLSASAHYCRFKTGDSKYLCLAKQEESLYFCRYVKTKGSRQRCVALHYGDKTYCAQVQDSEVKARCEAEAEARSIVLAERRAKAEAKRAQEQAAADATGR